MQIENDTTKPASPIKRWQFHFARRIWAHVGVIQTSSHTSKKKAECAARKMKDSGWAVWEVHSISPPNTQVGARDQ